MSYSISVALCTFNGARFVEEQVGSILNQSLPPGEIVVSDDGSTDDTLARIRSVYDAHGDTSIALRILTGDAGLGVTRNFQRAIEACTGELIALSDHDDVWHSDRLAAAVPAFDADPSLLLQHSDARLVGEEGEPLGHSLLEALAVSSTELTAISEGQVFGIYLRRNLATGATVLFRRPLLQQALPFPGEWVHDEWLAIIAAAVGRVQLLDAELIDYRQHGSNQIGAQKPTLRYRIGRLLQPRGSRYAELAERSRILSGRLESLPVAPALRQLARRKAEFETTRAALPAKRAARVVPVLREYRAGSYALLSSQGSLDVVRDLLQPV